MGQDIRRAKCDGGSSACKPAHRKRQSFDRSVVHGDGGGEDQSDSSVLVTTCATQTSSSSGVQIESPSWYTMRRDWMGRYASTMSPNTSLEPRGTSLADVRSGSGLCLACAASFASSNGYLPEPHNFVDTTHTSSTTMGSGTVLWMMTLFSMGYLMCLQHVLSDRHMRELDIVCVLMIGSALVLY